MVSLPSHLGATQKVKTPLPVSTRAEEFDDLLAEAQDWIWQSRFEEAFAIYQELVRQAPADARPQIGWATALLWAGLPDRALSHAQFALALDLTNVEAAIALARAYVGVGDKMRTPTPCWQRSMLSGDVVEMPGSMPIRLLARIPTVPWP